MSESFKELAELLGCAYVVGGSVRNSLIGLPVSDTDIASKLLPGQVLEICRGKYDARIVNEKLGTVLIDCEGTPVEHTTFRSESYKRGHTPQETVLGVSMEKDALRRDFSVNALYCDALSGELFDPTGRGLEDIKKRRLRTSTSDPNLIIADDGLRLLRLCRFVGELGFSVCEELLACAKENAEIINDISAERIFAELSKIMLCDTKYANKDGVRDALLIFCDMGLDEFVLGHELEQSAIKLCSGAPQDATLRWAGLLFGSDAAEVLSRLRAPNALTRAVVNIIGVEKKMHPQLRRTVIRAGKEAFEGYCLLTRDNECIEVLKQMRKADCPFTLRELKITGRDLIDIGVTPVKVGGVLNALLEECAIDPGLNEADALLEMGKGVAYGI